MLLTPLGTEFSSEGEGSLPLEDEEKTTSFDLREQATGLTETGVYERGNAIAAMRSFSYRAHTQHMKAIQSFAEDDERSDVSLLLTCTHYLFFYSVVTTKLLRLMIFSPKHARAPLNHKKTQQTLCRCCTRAKSRVC